MSEATEKKYFKVAECAKAMNCNPITVLRSIHAGELKAVRWSPRGNWHVERDELKRFLDARMEVTS